MEAKLYGIPTVEYRKKHPWILFSDIRDWKDEKELNEKLKEFCYSLLLSDLSHSNLSNEELNRNLILDLEYIKDDRVVDILQRLTNFVNYDSFVARTLIGVIRDRCDIKSITYLEKFKDSKNHDYVLEAINKLQCKDKYGEDDFTQYHLKNEEGRELLIDRLKNSIHEYYPYYIEIAGQLKDERIIPILKKIMDRDNADFRHLYINHLYQYSKNNGEQLKIRTALALVKQGEKEYLDYLRKKLKSEENDVKLAAAIALWDIKNKEGFETLMDLIKIRDIEKGNEYRSTLGFHGANVTIIRTACEILGEMGDKKAIPELRKLLKLNQNGVSGDGAGLRGVLRIGRAAAVALAELGDKSGVEFLMKGLTETFSQDGTIKDLEKLNQRTFIKNLIPILDSYGDRTTAAVAIINLLNHGK